MARGSAHQGGGGFSLESLAQVDHIGAGGSHVVDTFKVNSYYDTAEYQGRTVSEEGAIGQSMQRMEDARKARAFEEAQAAERAAAAKREAARSGPSSDRLWLGTGSSSGRSWLGTASRAVAEPTPAPVVALPELGAINVPRLEITPGTYLGARQSRPGGRNSSSGNSRKRCGRSSGRRSRQANRTAT